MGRKNLYAIKDLLKVGFYLNLILNVRHPVRNEVVLCTWGGGRGGYPV